MTVTAFKFLKDPPTDPGPVVVLYGSERFLQQAVLHRLPGVPAEGLADAAADDDADLNISRFEGKQAEWQTVADELRTFSMFGDARTIIIDAADDFVTRNRAGLEKYVQQPSQKSRLVLLVKKWPKTTRLFKAVEKQGLNVTCDAPKAGELPAWLTQSAELQHGKKLVRPAAMMLLELVGPILGRLDSELAKLSAFVGERPKIEVDDVKQLVGGWRAETTWELIDHIMAGHIDPALLCLEKLLTAREQPLMILGGVIFKFRQLAAATEHARTGQRLGQALVAAGVWKSNLQAAEQYLRRIGRPRAESLMRWLLETRDRLGGGAGSLSATQQRLELELLILKLAGKHPSAVRV